MTIIGSVLISIFVLFFFISPIYADDETVEIKKGDTCWDLSYQLVGDGARFPELYRENAQVLDEKAQSMGLHSSDYCGKIFPGILLKIPKSMTETAPLPARNFFSYIPMRPSPGFRPVARQDSAVPEFWWIGIVVGCILVSLHLLMRCVRFLIFLSEMDGYMVQTKQ